MVDTIPKEHQLVTQDFPHLAPSVCFVCEAAEQGAEFVDTLKNFQPAAFTALNGRKYVCTYCIRDLANHIGAFDQERDRYEAKLVDLREDLETASAALASYARLEEAVAALAAAGKPVAAKAVKKPIKKETAE